MSGMSGISGAGTLIPTDGVDDPGIRLAANIVIFTRQAGDFLMIFRFDSSVYFSHSGSTTTESHD